MNKIPLNIAGLDGGVIIKKGGGGGATINNQEKSVDITENGVTEVTADAGFTGLSKVKVTTAIPTEEKTVEITENGTTEVVANDGFLSKVIVNTNVASSGGGGSDMPVIGDGKTYLYIKISAEGRMDVPLSFQQSVSNGVTIDWGDGSVPETLDGTGNKNAKHKYAAIGNYVISLDTIDGCTLGLGRQSSSYSVMGSVGNNGKVYCNMLQAVEIGKGAAGISKYAFYNCYSLTSAVISEGVTSIGEAAFSGCYSLTSVVIPEGVTSIGSSAFSGCYSLTSVVIPEGVTSIGDNTFNYCQSLASVVIPNSVTSIGSNVFKNCSALASAVIPNSVTSIGSNVFSGCSSLASVVIPEGVTSIGNGMFYSCSSLASAVIPNSVTSLGGTMFYQCYSLASIVIPNNVTSIGVNMFDSCYGMAFCDFSSHASVPSLNNAAAFLNSSSDFKIIVPDNLYDEWIAATNWSTYASKIIKKSDWDASQS